MFSACIAALVAQAGGAASAAGAAEEAAKTELAALVKTVETLADYHVDFASLKLGPDGAEAVNEGRSGAASQEPWVVDFVRGQPVHYTRGHAEVFRGDKQMCYLDQKGRWITVDRPGEGETPTVARHDGMQARGMGKVIQELEAVPLVHEMVAGLSDQIASATRREADGCVAFEGLLSDEAARRFAKAARRKEKAADGKTKEKPATNGGGSDGATPEEADDAPPSGEPITAPADPARKAATTAKLNITTRDGVVELVEIDLITGGAQPRHVRKTFKLTNVGTTKIELPADVAAVLAPKSGGGS